MRSDPVAHAQRLRAQLDAILERVEVRPEGQRDFEATRELIAFRPEEGSELPAQSFADKNADVRLVSEDPATRTVIVDTPSAQLTYLRGKLQRWVEEPREGKERRNDKTIGPLSSLGLVTAEEQAGPRARQVRPKKNEVRWWEVACRGGARVDTAVTENTRRQMSRSFERLEVANVHQFLATERLVYFARMSGSALLSLLESTDCIYEFDLASPDVRGWLMVNDTEFPVRELGNFRWTPPAEGAPAVVILDTGTVSEHPMLRGALLMSQSVLSAEVSAEDTNGHGTRMAGASLFDDVPEAAELNRAQGTHWLQSVKLLVGDNTGSADESNRAFWPEITQAAIEKAEAVDERRRVYALAVTAPLPDPLSPTWWSHAVDRLAYAEGRGRLLCVSIGNADPINLALADGYPHFNLQHQLEDPAHATNALTVGAYTNKVTLPPEPDYAGVRCIAPEGGISLCTRAGLVGTDADAIKPDVVFEGGNCVDAGGWVATDLATLATVTTGPSFLQSPLVTHRDTSLATANAARFAAQVWAADPSLRPETVRGLVIHSASWTTQMKRQLPNLDERLALCGHGVPNLKLATECTRSRATIIVEDRLASAVSDVDDEGRPKERRQAKFFQLPVPRGLLQEVDRVEVRVTLSYFAEPNTFGRRQTRGLDLGWDMQGPNESEEQFRQRINFFRRDEAYKERPRSQGFTGWSIGPQRRRRGTVQSDRWEGAGAFLDEPKLIAVYPVLGWWDKRQLAELEMPFSLVVTVRGTNNVDLYTPIELALTVPVEVAGA
jgi:hypothetical protein